MDEIDEKALHGLSANIHKFTKDKAFVLLKDFLQPDNASDLETAAIKRLNMLPDSPGSHEMFELGESWVRYALNWRSKFLTTTSRKRDSLVLYSALTYRPRPPVRDNLRFVNTVT